MDDAREYQKSAVEEEDTPRAGDEDVQCREENTSPSSGTEDSVVEETILNSQVRPSRIRRESSKHEQKAPLLKRKRTELDSPPGSPECDLASPEAGNTHRTIDKEDEASSRRMTWEGGMSRKQGNFRNELNEDQPKDWMRRRADTSSYSAHTKASIAKQNEKVELSTVSRSGTAQQPSHVLDDRRPSLRGRTSHRNDELSDRRSSMVMGQVRSDHRQRSRNLHVVSPSQTATQDHPHMIGSSPEEPLKNEARMKESVDDIKPQLNALENVVEKELLEAKLRGMERERDEAREQLLLTQKELRTVKDNKKELKQTHDTLSGKIQYLQDQRSDRDLQEQEPQTHEVAKAENENLQIAVKELERNNAETLRKLDQTTEELISANIRAEQVEEDFLRSNEAHEKSKNDIEHLCNFIQKSSVASDTTIDTNTLEALTQSLGSEANTLLSRLIQLVERFDGTTKTLRNENVELQRQLSTKDVELSTAEKALEAQLSSSSAKTSGRKTSWKADKDNWEMLYRNEHEKLKTKTQQYSAFQETAQKWYQPDLERANRELQTNLARTQDESAKLGEATKKYQAQARKWENEYHLAQTNLDMRAVGFEEERQRQQDEMLLYIKEYYDKTNDAEHWRLKGLQERVRSLEHDLATTNDLFAQIKLDKARIEEEFKRHVDEKVAREKYVKDLECVVMSRGSRLLTSSVSVSNSVFDTEDRSPTSSLSASSSSTNVWLASPKVIIDKRPHIPRCHLPSHISAREAILAQLREEQEKARAGREEVEEIMERIREWKMGRLYPPKRDGWEDSVQKKWWERWEGDHWVDHEAEKAAAAAAEDKSDSTKKREETAKKHEDGINRVFDLEAR